MEALVGLALTADGNGAVFDVPTEDLDTFLSGICCMTCWVIGKRFLCRVQDSLGFVLIRDLYLWIEENMGGGDFPSQNWRYFSSVLFLLQNPPEILDPNNALRFSRFSPIHFYFQN